MKKFFLDNLGLKITAVVLSIGLWLLATSRGQSEISLDVPLELRNIPSKLEVLHQSVKVISLNIRGQERIIRGISSSDIRVSIDLSKAKEGEGIYIINKNNIKLPRAVTVTNLAPSNVKVFLEKTITKTVMVKPVIVGTPEKGFYVESIDVVPKTVVIEGKRAEVYKVYNIKTEPVDITGLKETLTVDLKLDLMGINLRTKKGEVKVRVVIAEREK